MVDEERVAQWTKDASIALLRSLDRNQVARLTSIVLSLLADREQRERYIGREGR